MGGINHEKLVVYNCHTAIPTLFPIDGWRYREKPFLATHPMVKSKTLPWQRAPLYRMDLGGSAVPVNINKQDLEKVDVVMFMSLKCIEITLTLYQLNIRVFSWPINNITR